MSACHAVAGFCQPDGVTGVRDQDDDTYQLVLLDLFPLYSELPSLTLKPTHRRVTHLAHGWCMRVHRGIEVVLLLCDSGYAVESWPIRRSVLEHLVGLKWLAQDGNRAVDPIVRELGRQATRRLNAVTTAGWKAAADPTFRVAIADGQAANADLELDTYLAFKHRCDKYGSAHDWASYLIETHNSHPGWETAAPYVAQGPSMTMLWDPEPIDRDDEGWAAMKLWETDAVMRLMMEDPPDDWETVLESTQKRIMRLSGQDSDSAEPDSGRQ